MYVHCSRSTILRASVVLPENESPHIRYNVLILRVYLDTTAKLSNSPRGGIEPPLLTKRYSRVNTQAGALRLVGSRLLPCVFTKG